MLADPDEDLYTQRKRERLHTLLTSDAAQNRNITAEIVPMRGDDFAQKLFSTLDIFQFMTAELTRYLREGDNDQGDDDVARER